MPLRKKHLRWTVAVLLLVGALAPILALTVYGLRLRGDAYGREVAAELESRLRCAAAVTGARPTGPSTAVAEAVELTWEAGGGRLTLRLEQVEATRDSFGWHVGADLGMLTISGPDPAETLGAINQRLAQSQPVSGLASFGVGSLQVGYEKGDRTVGIWEIFAVAHANAASLNVELRAMPPPNRRNSLSPASEQEERKRVPIGFLRFDPTSPNGVLAQASVDANGLPLRWARDWTEPDGTQCSRAEPSPYGLDLMVRYAAAEVQTKPTRLRIAHKQLDLGRRTAGVPGGPVEGTGNLVLAWTRPPQGDTELVATLEATDGRISPQTLRWLESLGAGLRGPQPPPTAPIAFDRLSVRCRVVGDRAWFEGPADPAGGIPLMTVRVLGVPVPVVRASPGPFDVRAVWPALAKALALDAAAK